MAVHLYWSGCLVRVRVRLSSNTCHYQIKQCFPHIYFTWAVHQDISTAVQVYSAIHFSFLCYLFSVQKNSTIPDHLTSGQSTLAPPLTSTGDHTGSYWIKASLCSCFVWMCCAVFPWMFFYYYYFWTLISFIMSFLYKWLICCYDHRNPGKKILPGRYATL